MSLVFDLDTDGQQQLANEAKENSVPVDELQSGFFQGVPTAIGMGVMRGGARSAQAVGLAGGGLLSLFEDQPGELTDPYFKAMDQYVGDAVDYWTPGANEVGTAGRVLGGFSEMALPLMATGGNPSLLIGSAELGGAQDLVKQGASVKGAVTGGIIQGLATAAGFKIPFLGKTLASRLASGAAGNLAVNAGSSALEKGALNETGDKAQGEQIHPLDLEARAVDVLSGLAFGGLAHLSAPSVRDAAATAADAQHFQQDTAPGIPADIGSSVAHQSAMEAAIRDTLEGKPVDLANTGITGADFIALPKPAGHLSEADELKGVDEVLAPEPGRADQEIEARFSKQLETDKPAAITEYSKLPGSDNGRILNTDLARELSPDYRTDRTRSAAVHEPASALVKEMYARKLEEAPAKGELPIVVFTAGGTGAGKSTAISSFPEMASEVRHAQIVYDTNLNNPISAVQKIDQALAAGKDVRIRYVSRDPVESLVHGALPRAMRMGRTVPLVEHAKTHAGGAATIKTLAERYSNDSRVKIQVIDNSGGKGGARIGSIDQIKIPEYDALLGDLHAALEKERAAGRISEAVYRGTTDAALQQRFRDQGGSGRIRSAPDPGNGQQPQPAGSGRVVDPIVLAARNALVESDFPIPTGELNVDGSPIVRSAREVMAEADADIAQAQHDAKGFDALVGCILTKGDG